MARDEGREERFRKAGKDLELASLGDGLQAVAGEVLGRLGVGRKAVTLANHGAGELTFSSFPCCWPTLGAKSRPRPPLRTETYLGAKAVGVLGELNELVRRQVDAGSGAGKVVDHHGQGGLVHDGVKEGEDGGTVAAHREGKVAFLLAFLPS